MLKHYTPQWLLAYNQDSYEIPSHGLVEVASADYDESNPDAPAIILSVKRPTGDSLPNIAINGWMPTPVGETGLVMVTGPALTTTSASVIVGETLGSVTDSFVPAADQMGLVMLSDMSDGKYLVGFGGIGILKPKCRFTADSAYTTSSEYVEGTITYQYGYGAEHPSNDAQFYNLETHTAGVYEFYADANDAGIASYSGGGTKWYIDIPECP